MWTYGFSWSADQVRLKSVMVYEEPEDTNPQGVQQYFDEAEAAKHYDGEVSSGGQVVYFEGTAPIETFDTFSRGDPGTAEDYEPPSAPEPDELPTPPSETRWRYETDYDAGETTVTYELGPEITAVRLLGVALNNTRLYETQFRTEYDRPLRPGDSITVETPPEQAGEDVTISWLSTEPYFVLDAYTLPTLDGA